MPLRSSLVLMALLLVPLSSPAHADVGKAQDLYKKGMAAYVLDHWDDAIRLFEAGYSEEPKPAFLYNLAQSYEKSMRYREAAAFFRKFVHYGWSDTKDRAEVEKRGLVLTDLNGDGKPDVAVACKDGSLVGVMINTSR